MEISQLRAFLEVARVNSFTEAARHLNVTQPSISLSIRKLEEYCGVKLLLRDSRQVSLTTSGEALLPYAREILRAMENGKRAAWTNAPSNTLRIGGFARYGSDLIPYVAKQLLDIHQELVMSIHSGSSQDLIQALDQGELDLAFVCRRNFLSGKIACIPVSKEYLVLVQSTEAPQLHQGITLRDLEGVPFVHFAKCIGYHRLIDRALRKRGCIPWVVAELDSVEGVASMVRRGIGVAFLPVVMEPSCATAGGVEMLNAVQTLNTVCSGVQAVNIVDLDPVEHQVYLAYRRDELTPVARSFLYLAGDLLPAFRASAPA